MPASPPRLGPDTFVTIDAARLAFPPMVTLAWMHRASGAVPVALGLRLDVAERPA